MATAVAEEKAVSESKKMYEIVFILKSSIPDEEASKVIDKVKGAIGSAGGEIVEVENVGKKKLAYEVRKEKRGVYLLIHFKGSQHTVAQLQRVCRLDEAIIKFMTVKVKPKNLTTFLAIKNAAPPFREGRGAPYKE